MNKKTKTLLKENNEFENQHLSKQSQEVMTNIVCYLRGSDLSEYNQEIVRRDINYMIADGEGRNETAESVVGRDYQSFCDEIIQLFPKRTTTEKILDTVNISTPAISIITLIWLVGKVVQALIDNTSIYHLEITLGEIVGNIAMVIEAIIILKYITRTAFTEAFTTKNKVKEFLSLWLKLVVLLIIPLCSYMLLISPSFPIIMPVAIGIMVVPLLVGAILNRVEKC